MSFNKKAKLEDDAQKQREDIPPAFYDVKHNFILDSYFITGEMITMPKIKDNGIYNKEFFTFEEFLLVHESSQQAFMNLSKKTDVVSKEKLLNETKKLLQEHIMKQIKANQVSLKKPRNT
jgi:hypothetical protein